MENQTHMSRLHMAGQSSPFKYFASTSNFKMSNIGFFARTGVPISLTETEKILGCTNFDENFWHVNFILINVRHYIYPCSKRKQPLNIFQMQNSLK